MGARSLRLPSHHSTREVTLDTGHSTCETLCSSCGHVPLQTNMAAGHFSQAGVFSQVMEQAERYAFIMWALSACPDGLGGAASEALVFDLMTALIGMGIILGVSGTLGGSPCSHC